MICLILLWTLSGIVAISYMAYSDWKDGLDLTIRDVVQALVFGTLLGPLSGVVLLPNGWETTLIRGKKK